MFKHRDIWQAIDRLAAAEGLSASGLARKAGLDPTTFNKSKRVTREGRERWPSTESLSKILEATNTSLEHFLGFMQSGSDLQPSRMLPVLGQSQASQAGYFDEAGFPRREGWDETLFPDLDDPHAYGLEIEGEGLEPLYRDGDMLVISPSASIRRGDRVVLRRREGGILICQLQRHSARRIDLQPLPGTAPAASPGNDPVADVLAVPVPPLVAGAEDYSFDVEDVAWLHRILWASQ